MPDGNAAAQRVLSIAKAIQDKYSIKFLGLTHSDNFDGVVSGLEFENLPYPTTKKEWLSHLSGSRELNYVKMFSPDVVIAYNFPALGLFRLLRYCRRNGIKIIGDVTEWYHPHNAIKWIDTELRMKVLHRKLDGLIVISNYLADYYATNCIVKVPPTVDMQTSIWQKDDAKSCDDCIKLFYVGSPGRGDKDKLDLVIDAIAPYSNLRLKIVGISIEQYRKLYKRINVPGNVEFVGRLSHKDAVNELKKADFSIFFRDPTRVNNAGFPTKYAEAASAGIPVITNHFSDIPKIIVPGKNGFIADNNIDSISNIIKVVASLSVEEVNVMKQYCREHGEMFDYKYYSDTLREFIDEASNQ